jgi:hypothetical protein
VERRKFLAVLGLDFKFSLVHHVASCYTDELQVICLRYTFVFQLKYVSPLILTA